jgi:hypothetical protein
VRPVDGLGADQSRRHDRAGALIASLAEYSLAA